jgi:transcription initiation factor TFIID subunit 9B
MTEANGQVNGEPSSSSAPQVDLHAPPNLSNAEQKPDTSSADSSTKKPRDARIIHLILASMGVSAYEERVPLMLMDFAYRKLLKVLSLL